MAQLKIVWTVTAVKQRNSIFKYWNERNNPGQSQGGFGTFINITVAWALFGKS